MTKKYDVFQNLIHRLLIMKHDHLNRREAVAGDQPDGQEDVEEEADQQDDHQGSRP